MTDEDDPVEMSLPAIVVAETRRLFRITPAAVDYLKPSLQTALVPAETEADARNIASQSDPLGQNWCDPVRFVAESIVTPERHVIGDVIFKSVPFNAKIPKARKG